MRSLPLSLLAAALGLAAYASPGPGYRAVAPVEVSDSGSRFIIRRTGNRAEVIRISPEPLPSKTRTARRAARALRRTTGCAIDWMQGDAALMHVGLHCGGAAPRRAHRRTDLDCLIVDEPPWRGAALDEYALDCTPRTVRATATAVTR